MTVPFISEMVTETSPVPAPEILTVMVPGIPGPQGIQGDTTAIVGPIMVSGTVTPDVNWYTTVQCLNVAGNLTIGALPTPTEPVGTITISLLQTAAFSVTWPAGIKWAGGAPAPTMPTMVNSELVVHLLWTGRGWRGTVMGVFF